MAQSVSVVPKVLTNNEAALDVKQHLQNDDCNYLLIVQGMRQGMSFRFPKMWRKLVGKQGTASMVNLFKVKIKGSTIKGKVQ
jgi:hypothetical protein